MGQSPTVLSIKLTVMMWQVREWGGEDEEDVGGGERRESGHEWEGRG